MGSNVALDEECKICKNCQNVGVEFRDKTNENDSREATTKCQEWLEKCTINSDGESIYSSETSAISETTIDEEEEEDTFDNSTEFVDKIICYNQPNKALPMDNVLPKSNHYEKVQMKQCKKIHLGNVTKIYGPVHITQTTSSVTHQVQSNNIFLQGSAVTVRPKRLSLVDRRSWLAQPPMEEKQYLEKPAKYVIISHTASEEGLTQAENVYLVRLTQTFHIESRKWSDIAYNFLVGSDGNVYEGRGWGVVGAHTYGYNAVGMGISFIGCFMNKLPSTTALEQARLLIQQGIDIGAIDKDYSLVGHCQCSPFESPGRRLFDEIKTWEHWNSHISRDQPNL